jgi:hypothetical protein
MVDSSAIITDDEDDTTIMTWYILIKKIKLKNSGWIILLFKGKNGCSDAATMKKPLYININCLFMFRQPCRLSSLHTLHFP